MEPHVALSNVDILHEIFTHLALPRWQETWEENDKQNRTTLLSAAKCCKTFSSSALDALWWKIDDVCHLLHLLPAFYLSGREYILDGIITERDWERFNSYAKRVKSLVFYDFGTIHPSVFLRLTQLKKFSPLLPNLQMISSMPGGSGLLSVLSENLLELSICSDTQDEIFPTVWTCLEALPGIAPNLQRLHVQTILSRASLNAFPRMSNLRTLSLFITGIRDLEFFHSLSYLEYLESFTIASSEEPVSIPTSPRTTVLPSRPFPALRKLDISVAPAAMVHLLKVFKYHPLQRLDLRQPSRNPSNGTYLPAVWHQVICDVAAKFYALKTLTMIGPSNDLSQPLFNVFEPLLELHEFESVHLDFPCLLFSDDDLKKVALAWPGLITLRMSGSQGTPTATIESLEAFAVGCPKLQGLSLPFDARELPSTDNLSISFNKLKTLDAQNSPIDSALSVARHLDRIFPNLKTIQSTVHERIWQEVGELLKTFKAVRMDQKARDFEFLKRARSSRRISTVD